MLLVPQTVAVIGAGSAGLVAARHLLAVGLPVCILEASSQVGGAWSTTNAGDKMWKGLHTNLSRHTCQFSDFLWTPGVTTTFPSKPDMDRYLSSYAEEFLLSNPDCNVLYDCQVTKIRPLNDISSPNYRVEWTDTSKQQQHSRDFGGVVVATGFFSRPHIPQGLKKILDENKNSNYPPFLIHSKDYTCHEDLFARKHHDAQTKHTESTTADKTVAVVGSSFSALEIAVDVTQNEDVRRVVHVMPQIPWVVPRYVPVKNTAIDGGGNDMFLPVDLAFYRRSKDFGDDNHPDPPSDFVMTPEECRQRHQSLQKMVGARQQDILGIPSDFDEPPMVAISDYYLDLVQDGTIEVIQGRATGVDPQVKTLTVTTSQNDQPQQTMYLNSIDKVICGTGYLPNLQSILDDSILQTLNYDANDNLFSPMTSCWECLHPKLPNMAFVGMYRGSYMGNVELQARLAAQVMSGKLQLTEQQYESQLDISRAIQNQEKKPQFPRGNYIGFMDSMARALNSSCSGADGKLFPRLNIKKGDMVIPAFYQCSDAIAKAAQNDLAKEIEKGQNGSHVPSIVLSALIGSWNFDRSIVHFSNNHRERVHGTIQYSRPKLDYVLYREDGLYELAPGKSLPVFREYEYVCCDDVLEVYFVEGGQRAHLFLSLKFQQDQSSNGYWVATSDHLCIKDLYKGDFKIKLDGLKATELVITYRVKGPAKDYEATTHMTPTTTAGNVLSPTM
jgi:hypothetical protein